MSLFLGNKVKESYIQCKVWIDSNGAHRLSVSPATDDVVVVTYDGSEFFFEEEIPSWVSILATQVAIGNYSETYGVEPSRTECGAFPTDVPFFAEWAPYIERNDLLLDHTVNHNSPVTMEQYSVLLPDNPERFFFHSYTICDDVCGILESIRKNIFDIGFQEGTVFLVPIRARILDIDGAEYTAIYVDDPGETLTFPVCGLAIGELPNWDKADLEEAVTALTNSDGDLVYYYRGDYETNENDGSSEDEGETESPF